MNADKMYSKAQKQFRARNYDAALEILDEIKKIAPKHKDAHFLEAKIWNERGNLVKEYYALKKLLPLLKVSTPEEKNFVVNIISAIGNPCSFLALQEEGLKFLSYAIELVGAKKIPFSMIGNAFSFAANSEKFSVADFRAFRDMFKLNLQNIKPYPRKFYGHEKIRVGLISGDFHLHPVMNWSWSLMTKLDKNLFEVYCYSNDKRRDKVNKYLRSVIANWHDIYDLTDKEAAQLIRDDEIDILFDLSGHTVGNRLGVAAYHPASVQISGIGYVLSTGIDCFDYFLSDIYCAGNPDYFTEKLIQLPHSHICYGPSIKFKPASVPPCTKNGFVTFGCFNRFGKMTDSMLRTWKKILDAVPNSRLVFKNKVFRTEDGKNFVKERLLNLGFDLERVDMRLFSPSYLIEYGDIDIALDTFPYTGGVTTCEALYMGVPVVSLYGDRQGSRFGLSILKNVGLDELAVGSHDEYIQRAVMLAGDWELLTILRKNLRPMMEKSPLMNSENYLHEIQEAFIKILDDARQKS